MPRSELDWIEQIRRMAAHRSPGLVLGIGDDCAIYRPRTDEDLVFTTDLLIQDVHFRLTYPAHAVGHRALARGLSDIAAMGATPRFCLLSLSITAETPSRWTRAFYRGLLDLAQRTRTTLAGGDLGRSDRVFADIVVCGSVARGRALRRDTAKPGDLLYVTGRLGGAALGLATGKGAGWKRHLRPEPRIDFGLRLAGRATSCMDLSDGLALDLHRLCLASGVAADIDAELPVFPGASIQQALHGGEDYELLFTLPARTRAPQGALRIGGIIHGIPGTITFGGHPLPASGYDHFASR